MVLDIHAFFRTTLIMKQLFKHSVVNNNICYLKLRQQYALTNIF